MADRRVKRERFLPYAYARLGLELDVSDVRVDGRPLATPPNRDAHVVELGSGWDVAELLVDASVAPAVLEAVLPAEERESQAWAWLLTLRCDGTRLRTGWRIPPASPEPLLLRQPLVLRGGELSGAAELQLYIVRAKPGQDRVPGRASAPGARLAGARGWELRIDRRPLPPGHYLDVRFRRFSEDAALEPHERGNLYRLEADAPEPVLWVNCEHASIERVLASEGTTGRQARLREVVFDLISVPVWQQLFLRAAWDFVRSGEVTYPWQEGVLDEVLADMYPLLKTSTQRRERLEHEAEDVTLLLARLDSALQRRVEVAAHAEKLIEELLG